MRVVAAPDTFRSTASAVDVAARIAAVAASRGWECDQVPLADGGEGTLEVLGGANRASWVTGPLGQRVLAGWRLSGGTAVIEAAAACGLVLAGGAEGNDAVDATTSGVGELIVEAIEAGAREIVVGLGGSASTDGGLGALRAVRSSARLHSVTLVAACDVRTGFLDAATVFGPQKGASANQVTLLSRRLARLAQVYRDEHGVDVTSLPGAGAAGGLAGGLAAIGAPLVSGFDLVADRVGLADAMEGADLVVTGEGFLDAESFEGKVVGGVASLGHELAVPVVAVVGEILAGVDLHGIEALSLVERVGRERASGDPLGAVSEVVEELLDRFG